MKQKLLSGKKIEWAAFILFFGLFFAVSFFHEPWFDEAQAWQIAKCASLREILFEIPHYECHPPLWHLILAVPAKLGFDFSVSLKAIGLLITSASAAIVLFRSAFPRPVRIALIFSYFFFYQYGVIVRPYGLMLLLFLILSLTLPRQNERPWLNFAVLVLICLSSAYGILLAGGICACILWDLFRKKGIKKLFLQLFTDQRTLSLFILFVFAVLIAVQIVPRADTYNSSFDETNPVIPRFICALLTLPGETLFSTASWFGRDGTLLQTVSFSAYELVMLSFLGALLWLLIVCASSKKNLKYLLVPYLFFAVFSAAVYLSGHHLGIVFIILLFWAQLTASDPERFETGKKILSRLAKTERDGKLLKGFWTAAAAICLAIPLWWTACASVNDVKYPYCYSAELASFLKETGLEDALILSGWSERQSTDPDTGAVKKYPNTFVVGNVVPVNAYFRKNLALNLNYGDDSHAFLYYRNPSPERSAQDAAKWREAGTPEVLIGKPDLTEVYGDSVTYSDFSLVAAVEYRFIWKTNASVSYMPVFLRNDLLGKYSLEPLSGLEYAFINGIVLTDEMREQIENGVPIEEILEPYLDAIFGEDK
ncbi:MAG: hypothetical protein IJV00_00470 [Clostridia bacterium]|nr:hypothetical protein [Clostridia bacterium]